MAVKKNQLYSSLWKSCDELRGGMDASQYKNYILTLLFMKYVSDKYAHQEYAMVEVPEGSSFEALLELRGDKDIGDKINKAITKLAEVNDLRGIIDQADFNDESELGQGKAMVDRLSELLAIFGNLDLRKNRAGGDDLLGDAYEYLMRHFARESGKSKGQFYTPAEVSRVMAKLLEIPADTPAHTTIYDPTCGSGSLLLKAMAEAPHGLTPYGQEMDNQTWALAQMNMFLHGHFSQEIEKGNTLSSPAWVGDDGLLKRFDYAVANPPFSYKSWRTGLDPENDQYRRFEYGIPPNKNGDYAFLLHLLSSLNSTGRGAIILPHGVLFRGNTEADIRRNLLQQGYIKGVVGLPPNLFYGTGIPACIIVLDKAGAGANRPVFMIDASRGFVKDGNKNRLRERDIHKIVDVFTKQFVLPRYARLVPLSEIEANDYNLNLPRYIDSSDPEDRHDLTAHLYGGIPQRDVNGLSDYWDTLPHLRQQLFQPSQRAGYSQPLLAPSQVKPTILQHASFVAFAQQTMAHYTAWRDTHRASLYALNPAQNPKKVIAPLAEDLLARFATVPLVDEYAIYQVLLDYWHSIMQDDVFIITLEGWQEGQIIREAEKDETPEITVKKGRKRIKLVGQLIPAAVIAQHYFKPELAHLAEQQAALDTATAAKESLEEEHTGEEGVLEDLQGSRGVTKSNVQDRAVEIRDEILQAYPPDSPEYQQADTIIKKFANKPWTPGRADPDDYFAELDVLHAYLTAYDAESDAKKALKATQQSLDQAVFKTYPTLSEADIKRLVIEDKWLAHLESELTTTVERIAHRLADRVQELISRYTAPLPQLEANVDDLTAKVEQHLQAMGVWLND